MKKSNNTPVKMALIALFVAVISFAVNAQKLPTVQQTSVRAPLTLKIDGKASEWDGQFQAYNKSTGLSYSLANDDDNLYLIMQSAQPRVIQKILMVGIMFTVNNTGRKSDKAKENVAITYPLVKWAFVLDILQKAGDRDMWSGAPPPVNPARRARMITLTRTDSTVALANKVFSQDAKNIKIAGIMDMPDTISIYNEHQIQVAAVFDNKGVFTYELAVPLKYLGLAVDKVQKFSYNIKLNSFNSIIGTYADPVTHEQVDADPDINSTTDFWGDYTLAKK